MLIYDALDRFWQRTFNGNLPRAENAPKHAVWGMLISWFDWIFVPFAPEINSVSWKSNWHLITKDYPIPICIFDPLSPGNPWQPMLLCQHWKSFCDLAVVLSLVQLLSYSLMWRFWLQVRLNFFVKFRRDIIRFCQARCIRALASFTINFLGLPEPFFLDTIEISAGFVIPTRIRFWISSTICNSSIFW